MLVEEDQLQNAVCPIMSQESEDHIEFCLTAFCSSSSGRR